MQSRNVVDPDFRWIEVITTGVLSAVTASMVGLAISHGLKIDDVLGVAGAIGGAGLGAWLAASAARASARAQSDRENSDRQEFVRRVLETVGEEMQGGTTADTQIPYMNFNVSFGANQLERHAHRTELALAMVEDANRRVGADFRALRALHTVIRTLRQTREQVDEMLAREKSGDFGRDAMQFIQTNRNSVRISIDLARRTLEGRDERDRRFAGLFGSSATVLRPATSNTVTADDR